MTPETRAKISQANKGRVFTDEWRANLSKAHLGKTSWRKGKKFVPDEVQKERRRTYAKKWRLENRERIREQAKQYNRDNRARRSELARLRYRNNPEAIRDYKRFKKYGVTGEEFRRVAGDNVCPVCGRKSPKNLSVDHDHTTGMVRGFICNNCNVALGRVNDSATTLRALADYLDASK